MAVVIPQVVTEDRASGAQIVDGSLRFDASKGHNLTRTPGSAGNRKTWTWSGWVKRSKLGGFQCLFAVSGGDAFRFENSPSDAISLNNGGTAVLKTSGLFRDPSAWYHVVLAVDTTQSSNRAKIYVNGELQVQGDPYALNEDTPFNSTVVHEIGRNPAATTRLLDGHLNNVYLIDGQALGPGYFGYTDPLTNTWRPKKFKPQATPNDGTVWSNGCSGNVVGPTLAFDGRIDSSSNSYTLGSNSWLWTNPVTDSITINSSLRVFGGTGYTSNTVELNGTQIGGTGVFGTTTQWTDLTSLLTLPVNLNSLEILVATGGFNLRAIEVDGVTLLDNDTSNMGVNAFHLPFDGNSPIGQDKSGNGNNWTPVNFGGSNSIEKATGAFPILNTDGGGKTAKPGTRPVTEGFTSIGVNDGTVWSSTTNGNFWTAISRGADKAFNGNVGGTDYAQATTGNTATVSGLGITGISTIRVNIAKNNTGDNWGTFALDSTDLTSWLQSNYPSIGNAGTWIDVSSQFTSSTLDAISITTNNATTDIRLAGVEVNGEILVDGMGLRLALPLVGSKDDVSNQINSGSTTKTITANGNAAASSAQSNFYGGSYYFDGTGDYLTIPSSADFAFGTGDYTIEGWFYRTSNSGTYRCYIGTQNIGTPVTGFFIFEGASTLYVYDATNTPIITTTPPGLNSWYHLAVTRNGTTVRLFINGVQVGQATSSANHSSSQSIFIGGDTSGGYNFTGYIQDLRIYKGTAKYTSNFIPASTNPDILPDTPSGVSGGSKLTKVTDGAVACGTGKVLTTPSSADFNFGTGDFTIEYFLYRNSLGNNDAALTNFSQVSSGYLICLHAGPGFNDASLYLNGAMVVQGGTPEAGKWIHYAYVRSGTTCKIYKNGIEIASATSSAQAGATNVMNIGAYSDGSSAINGFISNVHIVKGTALYTSNFTPPTRTLTAVANTKLLCCKSPTSATAFDVSPGTITANGNAAASNFNPFTTDINTVRGQESGYATLNPLNSATGTLSNGNLKYVINAVGATRGNLYATSGKYYFEVTITGTGNPYLGIAAGGKYNRTYTGGAGYIGENAIAVNNTGDIYLRTTSTSYPGKHTSVGNGVIMCAFDVDNKKIWWGKDGQWHRFDASTANLSSSSSRIEQGLDSTDFSSLNDAGGFTIHLGNSTTNTTTYEDVNFGQKPFKFPPPAGFQSLNAANVRPSTVIARPDQYVGIVTWTGSVATASATPGVNEPPVRTGWNFKPDFLWIKDRNQAFTIGHRLYDSVRGLGVNKHLNSEETSAEGSGNDETYGYVTGFVDGGFTSANGTLGNDYVNSSATNYVGWAWKAGHPNTPTNGAVTFDGSGDYLSVPASIDFRQTGDFTMECWIYPTSVSGVNVIIDGRGGSSSKLGPVLYLNGTNLVLDNGAGSVVTASSVISTNTWLHVAGTRSGNTWTLYLNGISRGSATDTSTYSSNTGVWIGNSWNSEFFDGFISNVRIVKGTALYTSAFTPPTSPLTNVTNTKLLTCQSNTFAGSAAVSPSVTDDYSAGVYLTDTGGSYSDRGGSSCTVTNNGSITSSSAGTNPFGLTTAADMTGTQRIDLNMGNVSSTFFQSAWTLEMFFKTSNTSDQNWFVGTSDTGAIWQTGWAIQYQSGSLQWAYDSPGGGSLKSLGIALSSNTWYFMRVQRTPGTSTPLKVWVYDSPTNLVGSFSGTVSDTSTHTRNSLEIGDVNGNANNLTANWQFANVMLTAGTVANQNIPTLSSGQRVDSTSVSLEPIPNGNAAATTYNPFDAFSVDGTGYSTASAAGLTAGTITPTGASIGTKQGFSIIGYRGNLTNGATVSHGLSSGPDMIIFKERTSTSAWYVYHRSLGATEELRLNENFAAATATKFYNTDPTSSVFYLGLDSATNAAADDYIAYCWHDVPGLQKFGSYIGNGNANGPFVELGFRPRVILVKSLALGHWSLIDSERSPDNPADNALYADLALAEDPNDNDRRFDFLSNGFKLRQGTSAQTNGSGVTYIYAAWAEAPSFNLYGAQSNAR